ncbi:MAG: HD domain-containing protein, partial [Planctomycetes bacterium]|nr:HD domain-containing protein [Planctomycetota bacterium]
MLSGGYRAVDRELEANDFPPLGVIVAQTDGNMIEHEKNLIPTRPREDPRDNLLAGAGTSETQWLDCFRRRLNDSYVESIRALVAAVEAKDPFTREHSATVATYAEAMARRMKLKPSEIDTIRAAALLHDVGKIGVPDALLTKPGPLTDDEYDVVKRHPETALSILGHITFLAAERPLILHHHERFDGDGYPDGLVGEQIPLGARVLAVADAIDAMFSPRSYKPAFDKQQVRDELMA